MIVTPYGRPLVLGAYLPAPPRLSAGPPVGLTAASAARATAGATTAVAGHTSTVGRVAAIAGGVLGIGVGIAAAVLSGGLAIPAAIQAVTTGVQAIRSNIASLLGSSEEPTTFSQEDLDLAIASIVAARESAPASEVGDRGFTGADVGRGFGGRGTPGGAPDITPDSPTFGGAAGAGAGAGIGPGPEADLGPSGGPEHESGVEAGGGAADPDRGGFGGDAY